MRANTSLSPLPCSNDRGPAGETKGCAEAVADCACRLAPVKLAEKMRSDTLTLASSSICPLCTLGVLQRMGVGKRAYLNSEARL